MKIIHCLLIALLFSVLPVARAETVKLSEEQFAKWVQDFRQEASRNGISENTLSEVFQGMTPLAKLIELDRKQPENTITFESYLKRVVPVSRVRKGKRLLQENKQLLEEISQKYGVPERVIVALWGIETDFGDFTGNFDIPTALATLAFEGRRAEFFRKELLNALMVIDGGHVQPKEMKGSWAGAMGQTQFMPSNFLAYAVDYDKDGRKDIWDTKADIFASIANYLAKSGWVKEGTWGHKVKVPDTFDAGLADLKISLTPEEWRQLGVTNESGGDLPRADGVSASIVLPGKKLENAYMVYNNYQVIMKWNRSLYFATAVGALSDAIGG